MVYLVQQENWFTETLAIIYSTAWVLESVIQIHRNYKIKTAQGMSINFYFLALNATIFYTIYNFAGYFLHSIGTGTVLIGDLWYTCGTLFLAFVEGFQFWYYPRGQNLLQMKTIVFIAVCWIFLIVNMFLIDVWEIMRETQYWNIFSIMGYCKILISFIKFLPAIYWNYKMKTTKGWPTSKVILDIIGGSLSLVSSGISIQGGLNITKLLLAILTLLYDFVFLFQRYWYKQSKGKLQYGIFGQGSKSEYNKLEGQ